MFTSPNEALRRTAKKQVRFEDEKLEERFELELMDEEPNATWMSRADFRAIQCDIFHAVQNCLGRRSYLDEENHCFRGLEAIVNGRKIQVQSFIQDFLEMQEDYKAYGLSYDAIGLHRFSENNSRSARERARSMADQDAWEARRVYAE